VGSGPVADDGDGVQGHQESLPHDQHTGFGASSALTFIHHDLSPEHLLVDPGTGQLTGILDWTDAILGDAARDFVFLVAWQGWAYTEEVLRNYPLSVDSGFRDRLRFTSRFLSVLWLGLAYERNTELEKLT
jgi:Ser/Thr protein kinase RdoA (MazF antagonist)